MDLYLQDSNYGKRKRGRPRKNPTLPEPIQKIIDSIEDKDRKEFQDIVEEERKKRKGNWDITKDDPISFLIDRYPMK